jgi:desulfoferrodoxin-like iron-binding protein
MQRRDIFKTLGLATLGVVVGSSLLSSATAETQEIEQKKLIINRMKMSYADPANPTDHEYKHTPDISFKEKDANGFTRIIITIGKKGIVHPTLENHWIDYLTIYVNDKLVSNMVMENGPIRGFGEHYLNLKSGDKVKVEAGCNLHGIWENTVEFV